MGFESHQPCLRVGLACLSVLVLIADQFAGSAFETLSPVARRQRQSVDQGVGGGADLAESDLWIFPPAAAASGGLGTNG